MGKQRKKTHELFGEFLQIGTGFRCVIQDVLSSRSSSLMCKVFTWNRYDKYVRSKKASSPPLHLLTELKEHPERWETAALTRGCRPVARWGNQVTGAASAAAEAGTPSAAPRCSFERWSTARRLHHGRHVTHKTVNNGKQKLRSCPCFSTRISSLRKYSEREWDVFTSKYLHAIKIRELNKLHETESLVAQLL